MRQHEHVTSQSTSSLVSAMSPILSTSIMLVCLNHRLAILPSLSNILQMLESPRETFGGSRAAAAAAALPRPAASVPRPTDPYVPNNQKPHACRSPFADRGRPVASARPQDPLSFAVSKSSPFSAAGPISRAGPTGRQSDAIAGIPLRDSRGKRFTRQGERESAPTVTDTDRIRYCQPKIHFMRGILCSLKLPRVAGLRRLAARPHCSHKGDSGLEVQQNFGRRIQLRGT
jgi:hypothetical protein